MTEFTDEQADGLEAALISILTALLDPSPIRSIPRIKTIAVTALKEFGTRDDRFFGKLEALETVARFDYQKMLLAYMAYVGRQEGTDFLPASPAAIPDLSESEVEKLNRMAADNRS